MGVWWDMMEMDRPWGFQQKWTILNDHPSSWQFLIWRVRKGSWVQPFLLKHAYEWSSFYLLMRCGNWTTLLAEASFWVVPLGRCYRQLRTIGFMICRLDSSKQAYSIQQVNVRIDILFTTCWGKIFNYGPQLFSNFFWYWKALLPGVYEVFGPRELEWFSISESVIRCHQTWQWKMITFFFGGWLFSYWNQPS